MKQTKIECDDLPCVATGDCVGDCCPVWQDCIEQNSPGRPTCEGGRGFIPYCSGAACRYFSECKKYGFRI